MLERNPESAAEIIASAIATDSKNETATETDSSRNSTETETVDLTNLIVEVNTTQPET